jgi:DNA primase
VSLYTKDSIDRVKEAVDMVELVGSRTDLRRVGTRWTGLCPLHEERTPSFSVNAEHGLYHCFGCDASGDAIAFVIETEGLDFREAVEQLAERYGVELKLEREDPEAERRRRERDRLLALLERAARFYATYLWEADEAAPARDYLSGRGLEEAVLRDFGVGFAPSAWDRVCGAARSDGFSPEELLGTGLAQRGKRGLIDRFRERITFPLADARGRVRGFGARALRDGQQPKYLNTAEGQVFHKGRQLFGLDRARARAARAGRVVVVEGYTDVLALHQAGIEEAVAIMGTALTADQLAELSRAAPRILLALDADSSGREAMLRAARAARDRELELLVVDMPAGSDPAELVLTEGTEAFSSRFEQAMPVPEFEVRRVIADEDLKSPAGKDRALNAVRPVIAATDEYSAMRHELVRYVSDRLDVPVQLVTAQLSTHTGRARTEAGTPEASRTRNAEVSPTERAFLVLCSGSGRLGTGYLERLNEQHLSSPVARQARDHLLAAADDPLGALPEDPDVAGLVTAVVLGSEEATEAVLHMSFLQLELLRVERELRAAARERNLERQDELAEARQAVRREMDAAMGQAT